MAEDERADSSEAKGSEAGGSTAGPSGDRGGRSGADRSRQPLELARARQLAIEALTAYRNARDPAGLVAVFEKLAEDVPAHWLLTGLLSVSSQLVDYLAASERVDPSDVVRALASLELDEELEGEEP